MNLDTYRNRWQEYHTKDIVYDSRKTYWRDVEWEKVERIVTCLAGKKYVLENNNPDFKFFVVYRFGGHVFIGTKKKSIIEWAVGWSNGKSCFMTDYDVITGGVLRQYTVPIEKVKNHIHPRVL